VAGGTGFYIRALTGDVALSGAFDSALRERLAREARLHPPEVLHAWLRARDPIRAQALSPGDGYRILRALEVALTRRDGGPEAPDPLPSGPSGADFTFRKLVLDVDDAELEARIERRVDAMLGAGLIEEAERIGAGAVAASAVGYPQALAYLAGRSTAAELRASLVRATRRYAKRQRTWFRSEPAVTWARPESARALAEGLLDD
jgi:tRNA dimethylallyltransferase